MKQKLTKAQRKLMEKAITQFGLYLGTVIRFGVAEGKTGRDAAQKDLEELSEHMVDTANEWGEQVK